MTLLEASKHILLGLILIGASAGSAFAQTTLKVSGSVIDEFGAPINKAHISFYSPDRIWQTTSDAAGQFQIDRLPIGVYELEIAAPPFKTKTIDAIRVTALSRSEDLQLKMVLAIGDLNANCGRRDIVSYGPAKTEEGNSIVGTVLVEPLLRKSPVANARVSLLNDQGAKLGEQITNERGEFQFKPTVPGRYIIEMRHPSYNLLRSTLFWTARENLTYLKLDPVPSGWIVACQ